MTTTFVVPERPVLDLSMRHFDHKIRGIRVIGTWLTSGSREPVLVLVPSNKSLEKTIPCIITLTNAWKWTEDIGDMFWAAITAAGFAPALGLNPIIAADIDRILDVVRNRLSDLLAMPPSPPRPRNIAGDVTLIDNNTGSVIQKDIYDDV